MRILLVEDEPDAARMIAKGLRERAYAVDVVADGARARQQAEVTDYDAVILDVMLPGQDGSRVPRCGRPHHDPDPDADGARFDESRIEGPDAGADDYLIVVRLRGADGAAARSRGATRRRWPSGCRSASWRSIRAICAASASRQQIAPRREARAADIWSGTQLAVAGCAKSPSMCGRRPTIQGRT